jgi:glutamine amidotransferase
MNVAIIDFGMGNLRSVEKAFHYVGAPGAFITSDPDRIAAADRAVLPGDGAFDATMDNLRGSGMDDAVKRFVASGRPFLGICIGMQVLLTSSEEGRAGVVGLDIVPGRVRRFAPMGGAGERIPVPQIGWNRLTPRPGSRLLAGLGDSAWVYFLHSYFCIPDDASVTAGTADYGVEYCAAAEAGRVFATQFHPEKSGDWGLQILRNFVTLD